jgi:hypothetical protein
MICRVVDDLPDFFQLLAFEFGGQAGDILAPDKSIAAAVLHQTSGRGPQIGELRSFHFLTSTHSRGYSTGRYITGISLGQEIGSGFVIIAGFSFFAG